MTPAEPPIDVVVIGSGAGGAFAAMALAEAGVRVLLLERGRRFDPRRDFPMTHPDWEIRPDAFAETGHVRDDPSLVVAEGPPLDPRYARLRSNGGSGGADPGRRRPFRYWRVFGLGGSTVHYQGEAHRFAEHAFRPATAYGFGVDWPLGYADLAPYYERAERILGVAGDPANPFKVPRGPFPNPAHPLSYGSRRIADGAARLGWSLLPNSLALPTRSRDGRPPCQWSGGCIYGCIFGAKSSADLTAIPRGEHTGRLRTLLEARALALESSPDGKVGAVVYRHAGKLARARPRAVVLALGAIETPRLLLANRSAPHRDGMANGSGLVGRYLWRRRMPS